MLSGPRKEPTWSVMGKIRGDQCDAGGTPQTCFPSNHCAHSPETFSDSENKDKCIKIFINVLPIIKGLLWCSKKHKGAKRHTARIRVNITSPLAKHTLKNPVCIRNTKIAYI